MTRHTKLHRPIPVHYLHSDGTIACKGLDLADVGRAANDGPLKITIYIEEATCEDCRRWYGCTQSTRLAS